MNVTYTSLFKTTVAHSYYASNICECLQYKASTQTTTIFDKYGFVMRLLHNGFEIYTNTSQTIEEKLNYISQVAGIDAFNFYGITTDQNFYNFTNIPMNELGVLTYVSDATDVSTDATIQLAETIISDTTTQYAVSISIKFDDIIRLKKSSDAIHFNIQMQARETQWNYYIINNSNQEYNQLEITGSNDIQFGQSEAVTLQNGQKALLFTSKTTKIPLKNEVTYTFDLINTKKTIAGDRKEIILKGLPIPNPQNLQVNNDHTIVSLIYIYI
ncbi:hypothetical protein U8527_02590 [Kordia algicida OT-1]|uniref:Uncharacterized protein n=1 Tax=Kordia algicida OT-1 TaxID=391587 RepID=A9DNI4_9FLAO|nr:hypothetical protein [Kordia algicida]EDP97199.1 hypothetical protein KAOT1_18592 [Kordia algicida OT-1]